MTQVAKLTFNPFQENMYIVYDDTRECIIFDPGCYEAHERQDLADFIENNGLKPVRLINTHCHLDHIFGNKFVAETYNLPLEIHEGEVIVLQSAPQVCMQYGIPYPQPSPMASKFIAAGDVIEFGNTRLEARFTPGHSPASLSFYCAAGKFVIAGDVLFQGSIGRTDLPGGNFETLAMSITNEFYTLPDDTVVHPGHGAATTVGVEKASNPFVRG